MTRKIMHFSCAAFLLFIITDAALCQKSFNTSSTSFGIDIGYFLPVGVWQEHRYAEGVNQFQGDIKISAEIDQKIFGLRMGLICGYSRLNLSDWEDYAKYKGDIIDASASITEFELLLKYPALKLSTSWINVDLGVGYFLMKGHEVFDAYSYDYNFFASRVGIITGIEYKQLIFNDIALVVIVKGIFVIDGVQYADGLNRDVMGVPMTIGIRYLF